MSKHANPLDYIINCCEQGLVPQQFDILNAKDELQKLRKELNALRDNFSHPVAWSRINYNGSMYDLRLIHNPYIDQSTVLPLYANKEEFKRFLKEDLTD